MKKKSLLLLISLSLNLILIYGFFSEVLNRGVSETHKNQQIEESIVSLKDLNTILKAKLTKSEIKSILKKEWPNDFFEKEGNLNTFTLSFSFDLNDDLKSLDFNPSVLGIIEEEK